MTRPGYFESAQASVSQVAKKPALPNQAESLVAGINAGNTAVKSAGLSMQHSTSDHSVLKTEPVCVAQTCHLVLIGAGLNAVWQNESTLDWQLLQNICQALNWPIENFSFFDTDLLISDASIFATMEEIIEIGVEWVLSMDSEHPISEPLSEGVQVIDVPSLEQMLCDPYAKQSFFQSVNPLLKQS